MPRTQISRRTMLRGMLGGAAVAVGLPMFEIFCNDHGDALAQGGGFPKRFGIFFWCNGNIPSRWTPAVTGPGWAVSEQLLPLASVQQHMTLISGMAVKTANTEAHGAGASGIFTGTSLYAGPQGNTFPGPSIDQLIADEIGTTTRFRSIETSCDAGGTHSYTGPYSGNPGETSPHALFERVFGAGFTAPGETPIVDPTIALRRSVLDAVMDDTARLRPKLGSADRLRLDQHLTGIRQLELQLAALEADPPSYAACTRPGEPLADGMYAPIEGRAQITELNAAFCDILAMTLACDQTRVFSHWLTRSVTDVLFQTVPDGHHRLTHDEPGDQPLVNEIVKQIMAKLAYMVDRFSQVPEGAGTLLDNMVLFATSDCSLGRQHRLDEYPILLAGTAGGKLRTNTHYRSPAAENTSKVLLSIMRALDINAASFGGDAGTSTDGLSGIEV